MIALCFVIIGVVVFLFIYCRSISGRDLFDYIQLDNIEQITVQKWWKMTLYHMISVLFY